MIVPLMYVNGRANGLTSHMLHAMDPNRITLKTTVCEDTLVMVKVEQISASCEYQLIWWTTTEKEELLSACMCDIVCV